MPRLKPHKDRKNKQHSTHTLGILAGKCGLVPASVDGRFLWPLWLCRTIFWEFHTPWLSVCQIWKAVFAHRLSRPVSAILEEQHDLILVSKQKEHWAPVHGVLFYYNMIRTGEYFSIFLFCSLFNNVIIWEWNESVNLDYSNMIGRELFPKISFFFSVPLVWSFVVSKDLLCRHIFIKATSLVESVVHPGTVVI